MERPWKKANFAFFIIFSRKKERDCAVVPSGGCIVFESEVGEGGEGGKEGYIISESVFIYWVDRRIDWLLN